MVCTRTYTDMEINNNTNNTHTMTNEEEIKENNKRDLEIANKALEYSKRKFCPPDDALTNYDIFSAFEAGAQWADLNNRNQTVSFFCISGDKKVTMTVQQLIDYYIEREIDDVASECNF